MNYFNLKYYKKDILINRILTQKLKFNNLKNSWYKRIKTNKNGKTLIVEYGKYKKQVYIFNNKTQKESFNINLI